MQFGLQFETQTEGKDAPAEKPAAVAEEPKAAKPRRKPVAAEPDAPAAIGPAEPAKPEPAKAPTPVLVGGTDNPTPDKPSGGAEVVRLDRFRKK